MPINPHQLLDLAKRQVGTAPGAVEADLRRGISTAYYALFHLLIQETMTSVVIDPTFRPKVARALQHGSMRSVCDKYNPANTNSLRQYIAPEGHGFPQQVITPELRQVAASFISLYAAREKADYDDSKTVQFTEALALVQQAEAAFQAWLTAQADPSGTTFLQELLCRSIMKRER
jgi:uncharacterized protein (UPF0332 family)